MRIAIFGTGSVGATFGGYLAQHGADVTFVARGEQLAAIRANGLRLDTGDEEIIIKPAQVTDTPSTEELFDVVLLCTKAWQIEEAAEEIKPILTADGFVIPLQNAIEAPRILSERLGLQQVFGGVCYTFSKIVAPGQVHVAPGSNCLLVFGELDNQRTTRLESFLHVVEETSGITAEVPSDIHYRRWKKFAWVSTAGLLGAITRLPIGVWRAAPETREMFEIVLAEAIAVGNACDANIPNSDFSSIVKHLDTRAEGVMTSMQRDLMNGVPSELEFQPGSVVRLGKEKGVPTPVTELLYSALLPLERVARGEMTPPTDV